MSPLLWLCALLGAATVALFVLVTALAWRRRWLGHRRKVRAAKVRDIQRRLMQGIWQGRVPDDLQRELSANRTLTAVMLRHVLELVRGVERTQLLGLASRTGAISHSARLLTHPNALKRIRGIRLLAPFQVPKVWRTLEQVMLGDDEYNVRLEAALALARANALPDPMTITNALCRDDRKLTPSHRLLFRSAVTHHADALVAIAHFHDLKMPRLLAIDALGHSGTMGVVSRLMPLMQARDPDIRCEVLRAARQSRDPKLEHWIHQGLLDPAWMVRAQAARTAGELRLRRTIPELQLLGGDANWWVRHNAAEALGAIERSVAVQAGAGPVAAPVAGTVLRA